MFYLAHLRNFCSVLKINQVTCLSIIKYQSLCYVSGFWKGGNFLVFFDPNPVCHYYSSPIAPSKCTYLYAKILPILSCLQFLYLKKKTTCISPFRTYIIPNNTLCSPFLKPLSLLSLSNRLESWPDAFFYVFSFWRVDKCITSKECLQVFSTVYRTT
jgi:hypothetical protein